jgi:hypothetical protein
MTERIVSFLDTLVATVGAVDNRYCLVEKREQPNGDTLTDMPYQYVGNGNYRPVEVDGGSVSYWRLVSNISFDTVDGNTAIKNLQATYPLRYVAMLRRDEVNPLTFSEDVSNIINGRNKDLQTQLQARNVNIVVNSVETQTPTIWREEFTVPVQEPNYTRSMVMIDLTVTVIAQRECWQNCDDFPDILQGFDWCGDTVQTVDRLTQEQQDCLSAYLCGSPAPVTEQINGVTIGTSASGTTNNQLIQDSAGASVGTSANPSVVSDSTININGVDEDVTEAESTFNMFVKLDGVQSGIYHVPTKTVNVTSTPCADANYTNSDGSYAGTVASGGTLNIPNITVTDSDGTTSSVPSVQDVVCTPANYGTRILSVMRRKYCVEAMCGFSFTYIDDEFAADGSAVIRVRRSSDNSEQDFTPSEITDGTLTTFTGAGDGYVTKFYDQTRNYFNLFNTSAGNQAKIVTSGILNTDSQGNPTAITTSSFGYYLGANGSAQTDLPLFSPVGTIWSVYRRFASTAVNFLVSISNNPCVGRAGTGSFPNSVSSGAATVTLNNSALADQNRDTLLAATDDVDAILFIKDIDYTASGNWRLSNGCLVWKDFAVGSEISEFVVSKKNWNAYESEIFADRNAYYSYY